MIPPVDRRPRYLQAAEALAALLDSDYEAGSLLPAAEQLAERIGVSRSTLREAMSFLERDGRLVRKQGRGTFVAKAATGILVNRLEQVSGLRNLAAASGVTGEIVEHEVVADGTLPDWAVALGADGGCSFLHAHLVIAVAGRRVAYFDDVVGPDPVAPAMLIERQITTLEYLCTNGGEPPAYTDSRIQAEIATAAVAERLQIRPGDAVLKMLETFYTDAGRPLAYQQAHLLTDYMDYRLVRRVTWRPRAAAPAAHEG